MNFLETVNWESTVRDYEFTRQAHRQIMDVVSNESFEDMSSEEVFRFLFQEISLVSFKDYLKRYLYERAGITEPFREIDDSVWQEIIINAFEETMRLTVLSRPPPDGIPLSKAGSPVTGSDGTRFSCWVSA